MKVTAFAIALLAGTSALAQDPDDIPRGQRDYHASSAGEYRLDPGHTAVLARVPHMGFSISVFRFDEVEGKLAWDPANPAANKLEAKVNPASVQTPVKGFAEALTGKDYLNTAAFPEATFVSDSFTPESDTSGKVTGQLTIMGKTHPATFDVTLVGAGMGYTGDEKGNPVIRNLIGVEASTTIDPQAYGLNAFFTDPIKIQIDTEFARTE